MSALPSPEDVHLFWFGEDAGAPAVLETKAKLWFNGGKEFDRELTDRFLPLLETLSAGPLGHDWAARAARGAACRDPRARPDEPQYLPRQPARAFAQDMLALHLCKDGLAKGETAALSEAERVFFYLPLEHSEAMEDQQRAVALFDALAKEAREPFAAFTKNTLDYAHQHLDVIRQFGRFPHRNAVVGRVSTPEEEEWLAEGGGF